MAGEKRKIGITLGDVAGIGPEIIMKVFAEERMYKICTPVLFGNPRVLSFYKKGLQVERFQYTVVKNLQQLSTNSLNIFPVWEEEFVITPGAPSATTGAYALKSLEAACAALRSNSIDALVTAPINKEHIHSDQFRYHGHTEYLMDYFGAEEHLMFMTSEDLKVGLATNHTPIKEVAQSLSVDTIYRKIKLMERSLKEDFGIDKPKIAVLGLNPHAGDNGIIGTEEADYIVPAIKKAKNEGTVVFGPYPADGFFGNEEHLKFDSVLAMYHDQGLIPFKYMAGSEGVNFTAGLPIVRTSPDHGTAESIAGKNMANPDSFRNAIYQALDIIDNRIVYKENRANPLVKRAVHSRADNE